MSEENDIVDFSYQAATPRRARQNQKRGRRCSDCGGAIGSNANTCPHCGRRFTPWTVWVFLIFIALLIGLPVLYAMIADHFNL